MALRRRNRLYRAIGVWNIYSNISRRAGEQDNHTVNNEKQTKPKITNTLRPRLCGDNLLTTQRRPQRSLSSQSLGKYWQLNQNNQETEHIRTQTNVNTKVSLTNNNIHKKPCKQKGQTESGLSPFMTFGQETERVYSYNPGLEPGRGTENQ